MTDRECPVCGSTAYCMARGELGHCPLEDNIAMTETTAIDQGRVEWVVNDNAELGVKIGSQFFWLHKGESFVYEDGTHDDGTPIMWRPVGKREFGESCHPARFYAPDARLPDRYTDELEYHAGLSVGTPDDCRWRSVKETENGK